MLVIFSPFWFHLRDQTRGMVDRRGGLRTNCSCFEDNVVRFEEELVGVVAVSVCTVAALFRRNELN